MRFGKAAEALQTCDRQDEPVDDALREAAQPGVDVATNLDAAQIRPDSGDLRGSTRTAGADAGPRRELGERRGHAGNQRIARVGAREKRGEHQARGSQRGQVLC